MILGKIERAIHILALLALVIVTNACAFETEENMGNKTYASARGWAQGGSLFTGSRVLPPGKLGSSAAVKMQAKLPEEDSLTTQFNLDSGDFTCNARAEIISDVNGNAVRRLVSVLDGMTITTRGKTISVTVRDYTDAAFGPDRKYNVAILATLGVRSGSKQPPILFPLTYFTPLGAETVIDATIPVATGTSATLVIPEDAGVIAVHSTAWADSAGAAIPTQSLIVSFENTTTVMKRYDALSYPDWVPLSPNSRVVRLENRTGFPSEWQVTFGIDG